MMSHIWTLVVGDGCHVSDSYVCVRACVCVCVLFCIKFLFKETLKQYCVQCIGSTKKLENGRKPTCVISSS